jgi:hypothetical protein
MAVYGLEWEFVRCLPFSVGRSREPTEFEGLLLAATVTAGVHGAIRLAATRSAPLSRIRRRRKGSRELGWN